MSKKKAGIIGILSVIVIVVCLVAFVMQWNRNRLLVKNLELGERYLLEQDYEAAVLAFSKAIELEPRRAESYLKLADAYVGLGDYDSAIQALEKGYEQTSDQTIQEKLTWNKSRLLAENLELGERYLLEQDYEAAVLAFSKAIELDLRRAESYLKLADAYVGLGDYDSAIQALEKGYEQTSDQTIQEKLNELRAGGEVVVWDDPVLERMLRQRLGLEGDVHVRDLDWIWDVVVLGDTNVYINREGENWSSRHLTLADDGSWFLDAYYSPNGHEEDRILYKERGDVQSINVFRYFRNLKTLRVVANHVTDISIISEMHLKQVNFFANDILDLTPLDMVNGDRTRQEQFVEIGDTFPHG